MPCFHDLHYCWRYFRAIYRHQLVRRLLHSSRSPGFESGWNLSLLIRRQRRDGPSRHQFENAELHVHSLHDVTNRMQGVEPVDVFV